MTTFRQKPAYAGMLLLIGFLLAFAVFIRVAALSAYPPGLWFDEAINGLDAHETVLNGPRLFYYRAGNPREPFYIYWISLFFTFLPPTISTLRFSNAFLNILSGIIFYPLARRFFTPRQSLFALFFFLFCRWNLHFARLAFRTQIFSFLMLLSVLLIVIYIDKKKHKLLYLIAFIHGLTFYTYLSSRLVPLVMILILIFLYRHSWRMAVVSSLKYAVVYVITISPLLLFFYNNPHFLLYRVQEVSLLSVSPTPFIDLWRNIWATLLGFFWQGDPVVQHNYEGLPLYLFPFSLFFISGIYLILRKKEMKYLQLIFWLVMAIGIATLSTRAPNTLRISFFAPFSIIILCTGLFHFIQWVKSYLPSFCRPCLTPFFLLLFIVMNLTIYFRWATDPLTHAHFNHDTVLLADQTTHFARRDNVRVPAVIYNHPTFQFKMLNTTEEQKDAIQSYLPDELLGDITGYVIVIPPSAIPENVPRQNIHARYPLQSVFETTWGEIIYIKETK